MHCPERQLGKMGGQSCTGHHICQTQRPELCQTLQVAKGQGLVGAGVNCELPELLQARQGAEVYPGKQRVALPVGGPSHKAQIELCQVSKRFEVRYVCAPGG